MPDERGREVPRRTG